MVRQYLFGFICGAVATCLANMGVTIGKWSSEKPRNMWIAEAKAPLFLSPLAPEVMPNTNVSTEMKSLQIDAYGLPAEFLNSKEQVNSLVEKAIDEMNHIQVLQMMSYHFSPSGLTSLWLLSASHASVHTWPEKGFVAIDFLTCGSSDLAYIAEFLEDLFREVSEDVVFQFTLAERGQGAKPRPVNDLGVQLASLHQEKIAIYRGKSQYQSIEVWDVLGNSWVDGLHDVLDRRLYLDGVLQLATDDDDLYHEALIHPAMIAHQGPEQVVIMGGGDGGALTEVLMHRCVKSVKLVEIDAQVVEVAKDVFPAFRDSFYDPRAEVVVADAFKWIADRASSHPASLDALFFDLLDMDVPSPLLDILFADDGLSRFVSQVHRSLRGDGFAVFQLGELSEHLRACLAVGGEEDNCQGALRQHAFVQELKGRFKSVTIYKQYVPSFLGNWVFAMATDGAEMAGRWERPEAEIDADIAERLYQHKELSFFRGAAMRSLRTEQSLEPDNIVRRYQPAPPAPAVESCPGLERARENSPYPGYEIPYMLAKSPNAYGIGVFTLRPIRRGEVIWRKREESFREVTEENWRELVFNHPFTKENGAKAFLEKDWINEYPVEQEHGPAITKMFMELDDARFTNHGYTPAKQEAFLEIADMDGASAAPAEWEYGRAIIASRDIGACEEILEDYQSGSKEFDKEIAQHRVAWWEAVLASYNLTSMHEYTPLAPGEFPAWALNTAPSNTD